MKHFSEFFNGFILEAQQYDEIEKRLSSNDGFPYQNYILNFVKQNGKQMYFIYGILGDRKYFTTEREIKNSTQDNQNTIKDKISGVKKTEKDQFAILVRSNDGKGTQKGYIRYDSLKRAIKNKSKIYPRRAIQWDSNEAKEAMNLTLEDKKFRQDFNELVEKFESNYVSYDEENLDIFFPAINQNIHLDSYEKFGEALKNIEDYDNVFMNKITSSFQNDEFETNDVFGVGDIWESLENGDDSEQQKTKKNWEKKEIEVAEKINDTLNKFKLENNVVLYSEKVGGSENSDVIVGAKINDQDLDKTGFFVEVKLDYNTASYLKFSMKYDVNGKKFVMVSKDGVNNGFSDKLNERLIQLWGNQEDLQTEFGQFSDNIRKCVVNFRSIVPKEIYDKIGLGNSEVKVFPDDFQVLAKIFNFYACDFIRKLVVMKSQYIFNSMSGNDVNAKRALETAKHVNQRLNGLSETTNLNAIMNMGFVQKFKKLYTMLLSSSKSQNENNKYNNVIMYRKIQNSQTKNEVQSMVKFIADYYVGKNCRYIQIDNDLYKFGFDKNPNPVNEEQSSNSKPVTITYNNNTYKVNPNVPEDPLLIKPEDFVQKMGSSNVRVEVRVVNVEGTWKLALRIYLERPENITNVKNFDDIDKNCWFLKMAQQENTFGNTPEK